MGKYARKAHTLRPIAERILNRCNITAPPVSVKKIADCLGIKIKYAPYDGEMAGVLVKGEGEAVIGVNSRHHPNRQRFTIAHELAHFVLEHTGEVHVDRLARQFSVSKRNPASAAAVDPHEIEANRFAAELLIPFRMISDELESESIDLEDHNFIKKLAKRYDVSLQAMTLRLVNLDD